MPHETPSPIELPADPIGRPGFGWTSVTIIIATFLLLAANAVSLRDWIDDLPPGAAQAQASALGERWVEVTETAAIGRPRQWLHDLWKAAEAARF